MNRDADVLSQIMTATGTSQSRLARISGVDESTIAQFLCGELTFSDDQLDRLLSCMGCCLEVTRRITFPELTRSEHRSWLLHRELAVYLAEETLIGWRPTILANIERNRIGVRGQPHIDNLARWQRIIEHGDLAAVRHALTGLDRQAIEMREVTPMGGLLSDNIRRQILRGTDEAETQPKNSLAVRVAAAKAAVAASANTDKRVDPEVPRLAQIDNIDGWPGL